MGLHLDVTVKAIDKALAEAKKLAEAHFDSIDAAQAKDRQDMLATCKSMGL